MHSDDISMLKSLSEFTTKLIGKIEEKHNIPKEEGHVALNTIMMYGIVC